MLQDGKIRQDYKAHGSVTLCESGLWGEVEIRVIFKNAIHSQNGASKEVNAG